MMVKFSKEDTKRFDKIWGKGGDVDKSVSKIKKIMKKYGQ